MTDPDQPTSRVDGGDLQVRAFRQAQPTGLEHAEAHRGFQGVDQPQHVPDLLNAPYYREVVALPGVNEVEDRPWALQGALSEEPDAVELDAWRALRRRDVRASVFGSE
jgi:hypothetical protein